MIYRMSEEGNGKLEGLEFVDIYPFVASFHKYKKDLAEDETRTFMSKQMEELKRISSKERIITMMFEFKLDIAEM